MADPNFLNDALKQINEEAKKNATDKPKPRGKDEVTFDDISSSSSDEEEVAPAKTKKEEEELEEEPKKSVSELMEIIREAKKEGNEHFALDGEKENKEGLKCYNKGLRTIEKVEDEPELKKNSDLKTELDILRISLLLNKAAVCNRMDLYKQSKIACTDILKMTGSLVTPAHKLKAYLRRGQAHLETGDINQSKQDFLSVLSLDKTNREAGKKLRQIKEILIAQRKRERDAYSNFITKKGLDLYGDQKSDNALSLEEYEKYKSAHQRLLGNQKLLTFEQFKRQTKNEKKELDGRLLREETERARLEKSLKSGDKPVEEVYEDKEVELDETDLKVMKEVKEQGYYNSTRKDVPSSSRKTSLPGPSKLLNAEKDNEDLVKSDSVQSSWNQGKTWEEKDIASEVRGEIEGKILNICKKIGGNDDSFVKVEKIGKFSGDVHRVYVAGKEGAVYDISLEVKLKGKIVMDGKEKKLSGKLNFGEIANGLKILDPKEVDCATSYGTSLQKLSDHSEEQKLFVQAVQVVENEVRNALQEVLEAKYLKR